MSLDLARQSIASHGLCGAVRSGWRGKLLPQFSWLCALETGAYLLWRAKSQLRQNPLPVRVIEYQLKGEPEAGAFYQLVTTVGPEIARAAELAALCAERWLAMRRLAQQDGAVFGKYVGAFATHRENLARANVDNTDAVIFQFGNE